MRINIIIVITSLIVTFVKAHSKGVIGATPDNTFLELEGQEHQIVLLWDDGQTELRNSYNLLLTKRNWMRIHIDADANEPGAKFSIFNTAMMFSEARRYLRLGLV